MYRNFALIGKPLAHTISPKIHNVFMYKNRINGGYCCFEVEEDQLGDIIYFFKKMNFLGFNVTLPYKEKIISFLDELDVDAKGVGAVNTVKVVNGKLVGYNTDIFGIKETFRHFGIDLTDKTILVIGAGGAARGLLYFLKHLSYKEIIILNRTVENAEKLVKEIGLQRYFISSLNSFDNSKKYDIIINASSAGFSGEFQFDSMKSEIVFDMQYSLGKKTLFLEKMEYKVGFDGILMLIGQAYKAFSIWNDVEFDIEYEKLIRMIEE